ncbi:MAG: TetR/AcrR family transcriptional regulator [Bacteroidales bacterium]|nr:TetR/AcrR family transcriptional regulator [Bacteroidales bacterium]
MQIIKDDIQRNIILKSKDIFLNHGFQKANMRDISAQSGVSLGNLYNYFASKDEIFLSVVCPVMVSLYKMLDRHHGKQSSDITVLKNENYLPNVLDEYLTLIRQHKDLLRLLLILSDGSRLKNFKTEYIQRSNSVVRTWLSDMKEKYPHIQTDFSDNFLSLHTFWMFETIEQIIKTETSDSDAAKTLGEYLTFEIQGWKQLTGI